MKDLAARARAGKLKPEEFQGGGFSISNMGMYGVSEFAAIINPPQAAILAVAAGEQRPVVKDGALAIATVMTCTLSVDHRVVDGALGAEWLAAFKRDGRRSAEPDAVAAVPERNPARRDAGRPAACCCTLLRALAEYEKLTHEVHRDGGGLRSRPVRPIRPPRMRCSRSRTARRSASRSGTTRSTASPARTGLFVEDVFVVAEQRGQGIGRAIFRAPRAPRHGARAAGRWTGRVLDWNAPGDRFLPAHRRAAR